MTTIIATIENTGKRTVSHNEGYNLEIAQFYGGTLNGRMVQISQGNYYIQLTPKDARKLVFELGKWVDKVEMIVLKPDKKLSLHELRNLLLIQKRGSKELGQRPPQYL